MLVDFTENDPDWDSKVSGLCCIFVSSAFTDFENERKALRRHVFPSLCELCLRHTCCFQAGVKEVQVATVSLAVKLPLST